MVEMTTLGSLASSPISYGVVQPGKNVGGGTPMVRVQDLQHGSASGSSMLHVSAEVHSRHRKTELHGGELLVSLVGTPGLTKIAPSMWQGFNVARAIGVVRSQDAKWISYCLETPLVKTQIDAALNTTVQATLNLRDLTKLELPFPAAAERERIVSALGSLDDKIEANNKLASTISALCDTMFQEVSSQATSSVALSALVSTQYGITTSATDSGNFHLLRVTDINKRPWIEYASVPYCTVSLEDEQKYRTSAGDILVARMADPGKAALIEHGDPPSVFASYLVRLVPGDKELAHYIYYFLRSPFYRRYAQAVGDGSVQRNMNARVIVAPDIPLAPRPEIGKFTNKVRSLHAYRTTLLREVRELSELRDYLLPRLMSGKITVRDAENLA